MVDYVKKVTVEIPGEHKMYESMSFSWETMCLSIQGVDIYTPDWENVITAFILKNNIKA